MIIFCCLIDQTIKKKRRAVVTTYLKDRFILSCFLLGLSHFKNSLSVYQEI